MKITRALVFALLALLPGVSALSAQPLHAGEAMQITLLGGNAGAPRDPQNVKAAVLLPGRLRSTELSADDLRFYIFPAQLTPAAGMDERYRGRGVLLWRRGDMAFADIRVPPLQETGGEFRLLAVLHEKGVPTLQVLCEKPVRYEAADLQVALVIDSSGSMARNDRQRRRISAASAFVDMAARDGRVGQVGIIRFSDVPQVLAPLTDISDTRRLHTALRQVNADGLTDIGRALVQALRLFDAGAQKRSAVILLTDGKNESVPYADEHLELAVRDIPVYCIGLSDEADMGLMERIAAETGGKVFRASDNRQLMAIYQRIAAEIGRRQVVFSRRIEGAGDAFSIPIDPAVRNVSFSVDAGPAEAQINLVAPGAGTAPLNHSAEDYQELRVDAPASGLWQVEVRRRAGDHPLTLTVSADTSLFLDFFPLVLAGDEVYIAATLANRLQPVSASLVTTLPGMGLPEVRLFDDGQNGDGQAGDGIYAAALRVGGDLRGKLVLRAFGQTGVDFMRQTDAGEVRIVHGGNTPLPVAAQMRETLESGVLDFGRVMPGQQAQTSLKLRYAGKGGALRLECAQLNAGKGEVYSAPEFTLPQSLELLSGEQEFSCGLAIPAGLAPGIYQGRAVLHAGGAQAGVEVRVEVARVELDLALDNLDLGSIFGGGETVVRIPYYLHSPRALLARVDSTSDDIVIVPENFELAPNRQQELELRITVAPQTRSGTHAGRLRISAGPVEQQLRLSFNVPEKGEQQTGVIAGHELGLMLAGNKRHSLALVHELTPPVTLAVATKLPETVAVIEPVADSAGQLLPDMAAVYEGAGEWREVLLWVLAALVLAGGLLLLRRTASNRMARFALLSLALHLPLIAFLAGYVLIVAQPVETPAPQIVAEIVSEGLASVAGTGSAERELLRSHGSAAAERRFKEGQLSQAPNKSNAAHMPSSSGVHLARALPAAPAAGGLPALPQAPGREILPQQRRTPHEPQLAPQLPQPEMVAGAQEEAATSVPAEAAAAMQTLRLVPNAQLAIVPQESREPSRTTPARAAPAPAIIDLATRHQPAAVGADPRATREREQQQTAPARALARPALNEELLAVELPQPQDAVYAGAEITAVPVAEPLERTFVEQVVLTTGGGKRNAVPESAQVPEALDAGPQTVRANIGHSENARAPSARIEGVQLLPQDAPEVEAVQLPVAVVAQGLPEEAALQSLAIAPQETVRERQSPVARPQIAAGSALPAAPKTPRPVQVGLPRETAATGGRENVAVTARVTNAAAPGRPELTVAGQDIAPTPGRMEAAPIVAPRERFGELGLSLQAMAPAGGGQTRVERTSIEFSDNRPQRLATEFPGAGGISRTAAESGHTPDSATAHTGGIGLAVGVVGSPARELFGGIAAAMPLGLSPTRLEARELSRYQLVAVMESRGLSPQELAALEDYLANGGRLWLYGRVMPPQLQRAGGFTRFTPEHPVFCGRYNLRGRLAFAEGVESGTGAVIATGSVEDAHLGALSENVFTALLGQAPGGAPATSTGNDSAVWLWQDFTGLAPGAHGWTVEDWGNPASIALAPDGSGGQGLLINIREGASGKTGASYVVPDHEGRRIDLSGREEIILDVFNSGNAATSLSVLFTTYDPQRGWDEYQTREVLLKAGWNRGLVLPLNALRSRALGGEGYDSPLHGARQCAKLTLLLRGGSTGGFLADNIRFR